MIRVEPHVPCLSHLLELYEADGRLKPIQVKAAILQGARSEGISYYDDARPWGDRLIGCALLYPLNDFTYELVFACRRELARHMLTVIRHARLTAARLPDDVRIRAVCRRDNVAGRRLAWLIGLRPAGISGDFKRYERHGKIQRRHHLHVHRRGDTPAARGDGARA